MDAIAQGYRARMPIRGGIPQAIERFGSAMLAGCLRFDLKPAFGPFPVLFLRRER